MAALLDLSNEILEIIIKLLMKRKVNFWDKDQFYGPGKVLRLTHPRLRSLVDPALFGEMRMKLNHTDRAESLWQRLTDQTISKNIRILDLRCDVGSAHYRTKEERMETLVGSASKLARRFLALHQANQSLPPGLANASSLAFPHLSSIFAHDLPASLLIPFLAPFTSVLSGVHISPTLFFFPNTKSNFPMPPIFIDFDRVQRPYKLDLPLQELPLLNLRSVRLCLADVFDWTTELLAQWRVHIQSLEMWTCETDTKNVSPLQIYGTVRDVAARSPNFTSLYYSMHDEAVGRMALLRHAQRDALFERLCLEDFAGRGIKAKIYTLKPDWEQQFVDARAARRIVLLSDVMETKESTT